MKTLLNLTLVTLLFIFTSCSDENSTDNMSEQKEEEIVEKEREKEEVVEEDKEVVLKVVNEYVSRVGNTEYPNTPINELYLINGFTGIRVTQSSWDSTKLSLLLPESAEFRTEEFSLNKEIYTWPTVQGDSIKAILTETPDQFNFEYILLKSKPGITLGTFRQGFISKTTDGDILELKNLVKGELEFLIRRSVDGNKRIFYYETGNGSHNTLTYQGSTGSLEVYTAKQIAITENTEKYSWTENGAKGVYTSSKTNETKNW